MLKFVSRTVLTLGALWSFPTIISESVVAQGDPVADIAFVVPVVATAPVVATVPALGANSTERVVRKLAVTSLSCGVATAADATAVGQSWVSAM